MQLGHTPWTEEGYALQQGAPSRGVGVEPTQRRVEFDDLVRPH